VGKFQHAILPRMLGLCSYFVSNFIFYSIERSSIYWTAKSSELCCRMLLAGSILVSEISRYVIVYFRMTSDTIVKHLDVFKDHLSGLLKVAKR
jgi:hypothetical protein